MLLAQTVLFHFGEMIMEFLRYAGLNVSEIIWMDHKDNWNCPTGYSIEFPYLSYKNELHHFQDRNLIVVDTRASGNLIPTDVWNKIYVDAIKLKLEYFADGTNASFAFF